MARAHAGAFVVATVAALVIDAALQLAIDAVRVSAYGGGAPWWITAHIVERGRWVVMAALMWGIAPRLGSAEHAVPLGAESRRAAWRDVAVAVAAVPLLWIAATWVVTALRFTLLGSWASDGRVFVSPDYYRGLLLDLTPWLMASATLWIVRPHLE
jgi:hypothetical protein